MKKILIATTALVASTGFAMAQELNISGLARVGVGYDEERADETIIISRFRLNFDASTETTSGVRLAARVRAEANENSDGTAGNLSFSGARYQISYEGFRFRAGNISNVFDDASTVQPFADIGLEGQIGMIDAFGFPGASFSSSGAGVNGVNALYSGGGLTVMASYAEDGFDGEDIAFGVGYAFGDYQVGVLFGEVEDASDAESNGDYYLLTLTGSNGPISWAVNVGENETNAAGGDDVAYGGSIAYDFNDLTTIQLVFSGGGAADIAGNSEAIGVGFNHSLGGGASLRGFVGEDIDSSTKADLGVVFTF